MSSIVSNLLVVEDSNPWNGIRVSFSKEKDCHFLLMVRFSSGLVTWQIRPFSSGCQYNISSLKELKFERVTRDEFLEYLETHHRNDYDWLIWNLEVLDGKYSGQVQGVL